MKYGPTPEHWAHMVSDYRQSDIDERKRQTGNKCEACAFRKYLQGAPCQYARLVHERINDIRILCRACHWRVTQLHRNGWPIPKATRYVIRTTWRRTRWKRRWWKFKRLARN